MLFNFADMNLLFLNKNVYNKISLMKVNLYEKMTLHIIYTKNECLRELFVRLAFENL